MTITISGTSGITFPAGGTGNPAGAVVGTSDSQTLTNKTIGSGYAGSTVTSGTAVASTSGTSIDFTSIPSWVKRITVMYNGVSTNGTAYPRIQLGSGSVQTSGYLSYSNTVANSSTNLILAATAGFDWYGSSASISMLGTAVFTLVSGTTWIANGQVNMLSNAQASLVGSVTLTGALDRVRITTSNGTDTFDAGSINILYE